MMSATFKGMGNSIWWLVEDHDHLGIGRECEKDYLEMSGLC